MTKKILNIENRQADYDEISKQSSRAEQGIRSICVMYDDHSSDKDSKDKIFLLKDNVHYRVFSLVHQYLIFLRELGFAEKYLQDIHNKEPKLLNAFPMGNPYFDKVELELSSVFDNIIFQLSSVFDYLSHMICYICKTQKSKTVYWTKLALSARGQGNEFSELSIKNVIVEMDKSFVGRLYDYRARLIHNKKDKHVFTTSVKPENFDFNVKILASDFALKHFQLVRTSHPDDDITLTFLSSWLIKQSFIEIEKILDAMKEEIIKNSTFHSNLRKPKSDNGFMIISVDPTTKIAKPVSDGLWEQYKQMK